MTDHLKYEVKLYELDNGRFNYYLYVSTRTGERWSQSIRIDSGSALTEADAIARAQEKATADRGTREEGMGTPKTVVLK